MAAKPKSRVSKKNNTQLTQFKFRWWMALILVVVVAGIGLVILRYSNASSVTNSYADKRVSGGSCSFGPLYSGSRMQSSGDWCAVGYFQSGIRKFMRDGDRKCAFMRDGVSGAKSTLGPVLTGDPKNGQWVTIYETTTCDV